MMHVGFECSSAGLQRPCVSLLHCINTPHEMRKQPQRYKRDGTRPQNPYDMEMISEFQSENYTERRKREIFGGHRHVCKT